jgi:lipopolysaccharide export system permease protein
VFDLSSFQFSRTDKKWFQGNRIMRNLSELQYDIDSIAHEVENTKIAFSNSKKSFFSYYDKKPEKLIIVQDTIGAFSSIDIATAVPETIQQVESNNATALQSSTVTVDSADLSKSFERVLRRKTERNRKKLIAKTTNPNPPLVVSIPSKKYLSDSAYSAKLDSIFQTSLNQHMMDRAAGKARSAKSQLTNTNSNLDDYLTDLRVFKIQWHKILASSLACIAMFFIGAPLGAIIKKGGLGVPFLVSILFFIIYYLLTMTGEKWAKQGIISVQIGVWAADIILLVAGLIFLRQARLDARFFEADYYLVIFDQVRKWLIERKLLPAPEQF